MPHLRIETNLPKSKIPVDFVHKSVPVLAKTLGKPEAQEDYNSKTIQLQEETSSEIPVVIPDTLMSFGGLSEPCAIANLMSIGALGVEENKKISKVIFEYVEKELGISTDRMYLTFQDEPTANVGFKGTTFKAIFG